MGGTWEYVGWEWQPVQYFFGEYQYAMDNRGRVPVPPKYRSSFADGGILTRGPLQRHLCLYTRESFQEQARLYASQPSHRRAGQIARQFFFGRSYDVELDGQGRILIPAALREFAQLENSIVVVGNGEYLAIWNPRLYQEWSEVVDRELEATLESLEPAP